MLFIIGGWDLEAKLPDDLHNIIFKFIFSAQSVTKFVKFHNIDLETFATQRQTRGRSRICRGVRPWQARAYDGGLVAEPQRGPVAEPLVGVRGSAP